MIFNYPHRLTKLEVWFPKYSTQYSDVGEKVALLHKDKVDHATGWFLVEFTKAKHLEGQRFCISKKKAQSCPVGTNGKAPMYEVPMSMLEDWGTASEVKQVITGFGW